MRRRSPAHPIHSTREDRLTKLIFWLSGLLLAILTMNVTVYLALTALYLGGRGLKSLARRRVKEVVLSALDDPGDERAGKSSKE